MATRQTLKTATGKAPVTRKQTSKYTSEQLANISDYKAKSPWAASWSNDMILEQIKKQSEMEADRAASEKADLDKLKIERDTARQEAINKFKSENDTNKGSVLRDKRKDLLLDDYTYRIDKTFKPEDREKFKQQVTNAYNNVIVGTTTKDINNYGEDGVVSGRYHGDVKGIQVRVPLDEQQPMLTHRNRYGMLIGDDYTPTKTLNHEYIHAYDDAMSEGNMKGSGSSRYTPEQQEDFRAVYPGTTDVERITAGNANIRGAIYDKYGVTKEAMDKKIDTISTDELIKIYNDNVSNGIPNADHFKTNGAFDENKVNRLRKTLKYAKAENSNSNNNINNLFG